RHQPRAPPSAPRGLEREQAPPLLREVRRLRHRAARHPTPRRGLARARRILGPRHRRPPRRDAAAPGRRDAGLPPAAAAGLDRFSIGEEERLLLVFFFFGRLRRRLLLDAGGEGGLLAGDPLADLLREASRPPRREALRDGGGHAVGVSAEGDR